MEKLAKISMICGIVSLVLGVTCYGGWVGMFVGLAGLIMGGISKTVTGADHGNTLKARTGMVLSTFGVILSVVGVGATFILPFFRR